MRTRVGRLTIPLLLVIAPVLAGLIGCGQALAPAAPLDPTTLLTPPSGATSSRILISSTAGATIYYTTDGSAPTTSSAQYNNPIYAYGNVPVTVKAFAVQGGLKSGTTTQTFAGITPFSTAATIGGTPQEQMPFNDILIVCYWDAAELNLTILYPLGSFLDNPSWACSIGGAAPASTVVTSGTTSGQVVFTYASAQTTGTANITVGATGAYYFDVTF